MVVLSNAASFIALSYWRSVEPGNNTTVIFARGKDE
jgi:hypothetical protein